MNENINTLMHNAEIYKDKINNVYLTMWNNVKAIQNKYNTVIDSLEPANKLAQDLEYNSAKEKNYYFNIYKNFARNSINKFQKFQNNTLWDEDKNVPYPVTVFIDIDSQTGTFNKYLYRPYLFHSSTSERFKNTAEFQQNAISYVNFKDISNFDWDKIEEYQYKVYLLEFLEYFIFPIQETPDLENEIAKMDFFRYTNWKYYVLKPQNERDALLEEMKLNSWDEEGIWNDINITLKKLLDGMLYMNASCQAILKLYQYLDDLKETSENQFIEYLGQIEDSKQ